MDLEAICRAILKAESLLLPWMGHIAFKKFDFTRQSQEILAAIGVMIFGSMQGGAVYYGWTSSEMPSMVCQFALTLAFVQILGAPYFKR